VRKLELLYELWASMCGRPVGATRVMLSGRTGRVRDQVREQSWRALVALTSKP
jgi:hypothetical protein